MNPRSILQIARWESEKAKPNLSLRQILFGLVAVLLIGGVVAATVGTFSIGGGLYTVGVSQNSPYYTPVSQNPTFHVESPSQAAFQHGSQDILITGSGVDIVSSQRGEAAATAFKQTIQTYNDARMKSEANQSAAFPVKITIRYVTSSGQVIQQTQAPATHHASTTTTHHSMLDRGIQTAKQLLPKPVLAGIALILAGLNALKHSILSPVTTTTNPNGMPSPFPFQSVVLALLFLVPLNFVAQTYGSSMMSERVKQRGELLLVSPVSAADIIIGKTLPYIGSMLVIAGILSALLGAGIVSVLATLPFIIAFLGGVFLGSLLSRSFKELTFITIAITVAVLAYAFIPALFTNVQPIALISPLTLIVDQLQGTGVSTAAFLFSTLPLTLVGVSLFGIGSGLYREEDLFAQQPLHEKLLDAFGNLVTKRRYIPVMTMGLLPLVFASELLALTVIFPLPHSIRLGVLMVSVAAIEEIAKTLPVYASFDRGRFPRTLYNGILAAVLTGGGFFIAEKFTTLAQFVGLESLNIGQQAFGTATTTNTTSPILSIGVLVAPLVLHMVASSFATIGATKSQRWYLVGLCAAILFHAAYDSVMVIHFA